MSRTSGTSHWTRALLSALSLFLITMNLIAIPSLAEEVAPTISSDKADYLPGERVTLTGAGWTGDATVNIVVNDTIDRSWQHDVNVDVAPDGSIRDSFILP